MAFSAPNFAFRYLRFWLSAGNSRGHGMHSPFVYRFIRDVLNDRTNYPDYKKVEALRKRLFRDQTWLDVEDLGAGSARGNQTQRRVSAIAKNAAKPARFGQLLYRLARYHQVSTVLELGTSLGISSCYLQLGQPGARLLTLEGSNTIAERARQNFAALELPHVEQILGNFDDTLAEAIERMGKLDMVFIDGNHRYEPTLRYFHQLLPALHNDSVLIFDDIHWSEEMERAWAAIQRHPSVRCSIDLFFVGLVFFRSEFHEPQHFNIRY